MKTRSNKTVPITKGIPSMAPAITLRVENLLFMKTRTTTTMYKFLIALSCAFATTAVFGQTTYTWTNATATDIGVGANWNPIGQPSGATQDTAQWDGVVPGNLALIYATGWPSTGFGTSGVKLNFTANQVGGVTITAPSSGNSPAAGIFGVTIASGAGAVAFGDNTTHLLAWATRPGTAGTIHPWVNNSANPATINSSVVWVAGGGVACVFDFGGTGNWILNENLRDNNSGAGPISVTLDGPGTLTWTPGGTFLASDPLGPITINGGAVILKGAGLCPTFASGVPVGNNTIVNNGALLKYDASGISDTISRVISGTGTNQVNSGTLTLSGANTYTGNTILSGGKLIVSSAENVGTSGPLGVGGTISFAGGTLGFSVNNIYDYSPRFSTAAGQAYSIDTGGQNVTLTNALTSSGGSLTKLGSGTLTLTGANTYSGLTAVGAGKLVLQGSAGLGNITVSNSASLGVTGGAQITPAALQVGTSSFGTLEFNNVTSTSTPLIAAGTVSAGGPIVINVNSGTFNTIGQSFPLISWTSGSAPPVTLGTLTGAGGNLSTNGNTIQLNITSLAFIWTGLNDGNWDFTTANDWKLNNVATVFQNGGTALFDDTAAGQTNVTLNTNVSPAGVTVNSTAKTYSITSGGANLISGSGGLTKNGNSMLTVSGGLNTYSGITTISGGTISVGALANGGSASDIGAAANTADKLVLNGGGLQYTGAGATSDHLFTLSTAGGTLDASGSGALNLNNAGTVALSGTGARTLTLTGSDASGDTLAAVLGDNGGGTVLTKSGTGTWILTGNNTISGAVTVAAGTLQVGTGGSSGSIGSGSVLDNGSLDFNLSSTLSVGTIIGSGSLTNDGGGTLILPGNNNYAAGTTINAGAVQVGNGGATGQLDAISPINNNGTLIFNSTGNSTISGIISGTGQLIKRGSGLLKFIGNNTYSGATTIDPGAQLQIWQGNTGANASPFMTNNGTLIMMRQDNNVAIYAGNISGTGSVVENVSNGNSGDSTLTGSNTYTGGTFILGGGIILGDNLNPGAGSILGNVFLTNNYAAATFGPFVPASITFNRPDDFTFPGSIVGQGSLTQLGSGMLTLTGANDYTNGTTITAGTLQIGNGGATGSIGSGSGPIVNNSLLIFNLSTASTVTAVISGVGALVKTGAGTLTLTNNNTYTGSTTLSNGTLAVTAVGGAVNMFGGTLVPGTVGAVGSLAIGGALNVTNGSISVALNKSLAQSNSTITVVGGVAVTSGTLNVANVGPALTVGDKFTIFNQPVSGLTVVPSGSFTVSNGLAVDGSITVLTATATNPTNITVQVSGNQLILSWPADHTGWHLQSQTNTLAKGLGTNWVTIPGTDASNSFTNTIGTGNGTVFYRMVFP